MEIESDKPAEVLVDELRPTEVISVYTSALLNIADLFPNVTCVAVGLNLLDDDPEIRELGRLFESRKIRLVAT